MITEVIAAETDTLGQAFGERVTAVIESQFVMQ